MRVSISGTVLLLSFALSTLLPAPASAQQEYWRAPDAAFVHLFEWPWRDIGRECEEFLGPAGFGAAYLRWSPSRAVAWRASSCAWPGAAGQ